MDLPADLHVIHQPQRLRIMTLLWRHRDVSFTAARDALDLTDGNLATHSKRLEAAGYLQSRRILQNDHFEARYRITPAGDQAFQQYLETLQRFLQENEPGPS